MQNVLRLETDYSACLEKFTPLIFNISTATCKIPKLQDSQSGHFGGGQTEKRVKNDDEHFSVANRCNQLENCSAYFVDYSSFSVLVLPYKKS